MPQLSGDQFVQWKSALIDAYGTQQYLEQLVLEATGQGLAFFALVVPGDNISSLVERVLAVAQQNNWLERLLSRAVELREADETLRRLYREYRILAAADPFQRVYLRKGVVLVGRQRLREALRDLWAPDGSRFLVIQGEKRSGKTHSTHLIDFLKDQPGGFEFIWADLEMLERDETESVTAAALGRAVAYQLHLEGMPEPASSEQVSTWVRRFVDWFTGALKMRQLTRLPGTAAAPHQVWVVVDSFSRVRLAEGLIDLVLALAQRVNSNLSDVRLVLLDTPADLFQDLQTHVSGIGFEQIDEIADEAIAQFVWAVYFMHVDVAQREEFRPQVNQSVQRILQKLAQADRNSRAAVLHRVACEEAERIRGNLAVATASGPQSMEVTSA